LDTWEEESREEFERLEEGRDEEWWPTEPRYDLELLQGLPHSRGISLRGRKEPEGKLKKTKHARDE